MAKYKKYNYSQMVMVPVSLKDQLMPSTLEHTIHDVVEKKVDLSVFDDNYSNFRKRDELYKNQDRFKDGVNNRPKKKEHSAKHKIFSLEEFEYDCKVGKYKCPNGKYLNRESLNHKVRNKVYHYYRAREADCRECLLRSKCLSQKKGKARALLIPLGYIDKKAKPLSLSQKMKEKIDNDYFLFRHRQPTF